MKRLLSILLAAALLLSLCACGGPAADSTEDPSVTDAPTDPPTEPPTEAHSETLPATPIFDPVAAAPLIGTWKTGYIMTGEMMGDATFTSRVAFPLAFTFDDQGGMTVGFLASELNSAIETYTIALKTHQINKIYQSYADRGYDKTAANNAVRQNYGMSVEEYVQTLIDSINFAALFSAYSSSGYYTVDGEYLYLSLSGDSPRELIRYKLEGDTLILHSTSDPTGWDTLNLTFPVTFTRVTG